MGWPVVVVVVVVRVGAGEGWWCRLGVGGAGEGEEAGVAEEVGEVTVDGGCCFFFSASL